LAAVRKAKNGGKKYVQNVKFYTLFQAITVIGNLGGDIKMAGS
jgi:hypothetical protein